MDTIYNKFSEYLISSKNSEAINYAINSVKEGKISISDLYENVIYRFLRDNLCHKHQEREVYKDHIYISVCRTVIENMYQYVEGNKSVSNNKRVLVTAPVGELFEIYPRIFSDLFKLEGYEVTYIGVDSSEEEILNCIDDNSFDYLFLSINNYYNLSGSKDMIDSIKVETENKLGIIISGYAVERNLEFSKKMGANYIFTKFSDIKKLKEAIDEVSV